MFNYTHTGRLSITVPNDQQLSIVNGDESVTLTCVSFGDDITGVYWERVNDGPLPTQSNMSSLMKNSPLVTSLHLTITRARPMHSGRYRCIAYSQWGMAQSNDVTVTIKSKRRTEILFLTVKYAVQLLLQPSLNSLLI